MASYKLWLAGLPGLLGLSRAQAQEIDLGRATYGVSAVRANGRRQLVQQPALDVRLPLYQHAGTRLGAALSYRALLSGDLAGIDNLQGLGGQLVLGQRLTDKNTLTVAASGGVYADWRDVRGEDFRWTATGQLRHRYSASLAVGVGLNYNRQFFGNQLVPYLDVQWAITARLRLTGQPPFRQQLVYALTPRLGLGLDASGTSTSYRLSARTDSSRYVQATQWNVGALVEYRLAPHWVLVAQAGRLAVQDYRTFASDVRVPWTIGLGRGGTRTPLTEVSSPSWTGQLTLAFRLGQP